MCTMVCSNYQSSTNLQLTEELHHHTTQAFTFNAKQTGSNYIVMQSWNFALWKVERVGFDSWCKKVQKRLWHRIEITAQHTTVRRFLFCVVLFTPCDHLDFFNVHLNESTQMFLHFSSIEMQPPRTATKPAFSSLAMRHLACKATMLGQQLFFKWSNRPAVPLAATLIQHCLRATTSSLFGTSLTI